ncbi:MAG: STAS domain-containing protein [Chloroflexota bacterium]|nr:STAS domain-containing protein [Chloroflexota bacterium]
MELQHRTEGNIEILELSGRFDAFEVPTVVKWFDDHATAPYILVNLKGVGFIDSSGLSTLVRGLKRCRQNNGELSLCELQQAVLIIFELTRLDKAFRIFRGENEAISQMTQSG